VNKDDYIICNTLYVYTPVQVSTLSVDLVVVFAMFVFMLILLCFCVATVFFGEYIV